MPSFTNSGTNIYQYHKDIVIERSISVPPWHHSIPRHQPHVQHRTNQIALNSNMTNGILIINHSPSTSPSDHKLITRDKILYNWSEVVHYGINATCY